jgi:hypothetical protein
VCIPNGPRRCWNDDECGTAEFCQRDTFSCVAKLEAGSSLPHDGLHDVCPSGTLVSAACVSGRCNAAGATCAQDVGATCISAHDCMSNVCHEDGKCGLPLERGACTAANAATVCRSRTCSKSGVCSLPNSCAADGDCAQGLYCDLSSKTCVPLLLPGAALPTDRGPCAPDGAVNRACLSNTCNPVTNTCAGANATSACTAASECSSNVCGGDGQCGRGLGSGPCSAETAANVCRSGKCAARSGVCVAEGEGACWLDEDCSDTQFCDQATRRCTAQLYSGQTLPADGLHENCPANGRNSACVTGHCNAETDSCASANRIECTAPRECSSNLCGDNGQCGLADGEQGCDLVTASIVCQSGACTNAGACSAEAVATDGCTTDESCGANQYCNATAKRCTQRLSNGATLPSDGGHAACPASHLNNACESGHCNADHCSTVSLAGGGLCSVSSPGTDGQRGALLVFLGCLLATASRVVRRRTRR